MTKHQPATPLPQLFYTTGALRKDSDAYDVFAIGDVTVYSDIKIGNFTEEQIAAYIAHAANAYPRLVAALQACADWDGTDSIAAILRELGEDA